MDRYTTFILKHRKAIITVFLVLTVICGILSLQVGVNYKFADYLPDDAASTKALDTMEEEYSQSIPNVRVLIYKVSIPQALSYKEQLEAVDGVEAVTWLDDTINIYEPIENADPDTVDAWYKNSDALYSVTVSENNEEKKPQSMKSAKSSAMIMQCPARQSRMSLPRYILQKRSRKSC